MDTTTITDADIRSYLGHNGRECRVRVKRNGEVHRYGLPNVIDRSRDFWTYVGERDHFAATIQDLRDATIAEEIDIYGGARVR